jgi:hypothetical protein
VTLAVGTAVRLVFVTRPTPDLLTDPPGHDARIRDDALGADGSVIFQPSAGALLRLFDTSYRVQYQPLADPSAEGVPASQVETLTATRADQQLVALGYLAHADGSADRDKADFALFTPSERAMLMFQRDQGLPPTGALEEEALTALERAHEALVAAYPLEPSQAPYHRGVEDEGHDVALLASGARVVVLAKFDDAIPYRIYRSGEPGHYDAEVTYATSHPPLDERGHRTPSSFGMTAGHEAVLLVRRLAIANNAPLEVWTSPRSGNLGATLRAGWTGDEFQDRIALGHGRSASVTVKADSGGDHRGGADEVSSVDICLSWRRRVLAVTTARIYQPIVVPLAVHPVAIHATSTSGESLAESVEVAQWDEARNVLRAIWSQAGIVLDAPETLPRPIPVHLGAPPLSTDDRSSAYVVLLGGSNAANSDLDALFRAAYQPGALNLYLVPRVKSYRRSNRPDWEVLAQAFAVHPDEFPVSDDLRARRPCVVVGIEGWTSTGELSASPHADPIRLAKTIAHEIGHVLGLTHTHAMEGTRIAFGGEWYYLMAPSNAPGVLIPGPGDDRGQRQSPHIDQRGVAAARRTALDLIGNRV